MSEPVIEATDLTVGWGNRVLLESLNFTVQRGEVFVILGGSGSGKSTLLRHLIGLARPLRGELRVLGQHPSHMDPGRLQIRAPRFGVLFQFGALLGSMTVAENVALPLTHWTALSAAAVRAIVRAKLRLVGMEQSCDLLPQELSGGMKKRAALARALALEPELIFLDEPTAGLDPIHSGEIDDLIVTLNRGLGVTVVLVTHDLDSLFSIGTRCILLDPVAKGIICEGEPRALLRADVDPRVQAFLQRHASRGRQS